MKYILFLTFFIAQLLNGEALTLTSSSNKIEILPFSSVYIDKSKTKKLAEVKNQTFISNSKKSLLYGLERDFTLWIKFTLHNISKEKTQKILAFDYALLHEIVLYDTRKEIAKDGAINKTKDELFIKPAFLVNLNPNEKKTYYVKINISTAGYVVNLKAFVPSLYTKYDLHFQIIIFFFFGAMSILAVYNLFLYIFTKDKVYIYYVLYMLSMIFYEYLYVGFSQIYFLSHSVSLVLLDGIVAFATLQLIFAVLFAREFLNSKKYPFLDKILVSYLYLCVIISLCTYKNILLDSFVVVAFFPLFFILIYLGIKSYKNNHSLAILYLIGWSVLVSSWFLSMLYNTGFFDIFIYLPYYVESCILFEASIFSIALAKRINILKDEKYNLQTKLIQNEQNEKKILELKVDERTKALSAALKQKEFLFKELHHRVKNNMQMVVSLMRLQSNQNQIPQLKPFLSVAINRIHAISILHELLYKKNNLGSVNVEEYFSSLISGLKKLFVGEIEIHYKITSHLDTNDAIYCGLIINELVSNSFKHAFVKKGNIYITLKKIQDYYHLNIKDDGKGYSKNSKKNLGLLIISTLVEEQLDGKLSIKSLNGTESNIIWKDRNFE